MRTPQNVVYWRSRREVAWDGQPPVEEYIGLIREALVLGYSSARDPWQEVPHVSRRVRRYRAGWRACKPRTFCCQGIDGHLDDLPKPW